jgi:very-short-patch-repair endonuclease
MRTAAVTLDDEMARWAEVQHGLVAQWQLRSIGASPGALHHRVAGNRRWDSPAHGVYRLIGSGKTWRQSLLAAVFTAGPGAVASHRAAAALWEIPGFLPGPTEVLRLRHTDHRSTAGPVHETRVLPPSHITVVDAIPVTGPARTLFDLAGSVSALRVERALDSCLARGLVDLATLHALLGDLRGRGRRGVGIMRRLLDDRGPAFVAPESELERKLLAVLTAAGLPVPRRQVWAGGERMAGRVDFAYPDRSLVVEADGRRHHMSRLDFESDRRRDNWLMASGWRVLRFTWEQVHSEPDEVVRLVREALRAAA